MCHLVPDLKKILCNIVSVKLSIMGCGVSNSQDTDSQAMSHSEKTIKSALLIQRWFRSYQARMETRRRCTWSIFQSIEYSGEQDQHNLYNFFNDMLLTLGGNDKSKVYAEGDKDDEDDELSEYVIDHSYDGPHPTFPLSHETMLDLIEAFKKKQVLHTKYVLKILKQMQELLKERPNISQATTAIAKQITVCGDLHGKIEDLFLIFYKNGIPSADNPYIFNGDFVDRGENSIEIAMLLFGFQIVYPNEVYINRGNHEDHIMNLRYGLIRELQVKYKSYTQVILKELAHVFGWLPIVTLIDKKILVCHGGVSDMTDLEYLSTIERQKYLSVLKPPLKDGSMSLEGIREEDIGDRIDLKEWRQVLDVLWSDPKPQPGCTPNKFRGGGCYFGPDVTKAILEKHNLKLLIRSHECKQNGYEYSHDGKVLTVFSASNYYEMGSNRGAYIKFGRDLKPHPVQYMYVASTSTRPLTARQNLSIIEESALRNVREKIIANKTVLLEAFKQSDPNETGFITQTQWAKAMSEGLHLDLPWLTIRNQLIKMNDDGRVEYVTCLQQEINFNGSRLNGPSFTEVIYRNKTALETIFRALDKDHSGCITMDEFSEGCKLLSQHLQTQMSDEVVSDMAKSLDINKDGQIDFNEFLEAFRLVDIQEKNLQKNQENLDKLKSHADLNQIANGDENQNSV
ncbi:serine/threonine-protein phosphatase with EF-hands 2-like [Antedon mediterranea]|uniref:serine/threonine-protein phosphatase with EF-hands 2-like n=1 Tax=Antedon mediterranea TaxID=105859 RepID=UPI003AF5577D